MRTLIVDVIFPGMRRILPPSMVTPPSYAMLLAIGLQESNFERRSQVGGPARGFWQFERAGVHAVRMHPETRVQAASVLETLNYPPGLLDVDVLVAITHNDLLAACFARLLLWTLPQAVPRRLEYEEGWTQYLAAWRPGKPRPADWKFNYATAWASIDPQGTLEA